MLVQGFSLSGGGRWELGQVDRLVVLGRQVLVVDSLGHGKSDQPHDPEAYRWPAAAVDIVAAMDAAGVARATLWGYSSVGPCSPPPRWRITERIRASPGTHALRGDRTECDGGTGGPISGLG